MVSLHFEFCNGLSVANGLTLQRKIHCKLKMKLQRIIRCNLFYFATENPLQFKINLQRIIRCKWFLIATENPLQIKFATDNPLQDNYILQRIIRCKLF